MHNRAINPVAQKRRFACDCHRGHYQVHVGRRQEELEVGGHLGNVLQDH